MLRLLLTVKECTSSVSMDISTDEPANCPLVLQVRHLFSSEEHLYMSRERASAATTEILRYGTLGIQHGVGCYVDRILGFTR